MLLCSMDCPKCFHENLATEMMFGFGSVLVVWELLLVGLESLGEVSDLVAEFRLVFDALFVKVGI